MIILLLYEVRSLLGDLLEFHEQLKLFACCHLATVVHVVEFFSLGHQFCLPVGLNLDVLFCHVHLLICLAQEILQVDHVLVNFTLLNLQLGYFVMLALDLSFKVFACVNWHTERVDRLIVGTKLLLKKLPLNFKLRNFGILNINLLVDKALLLIKLFLVFLLFLFNHLKLALNMHKCFLSLTLCYLELLLVVLPLVLQMRQFDQFHLLIFLNGGLLGLKHYNLLFLCF